jgi:hypothetical protein
MQGMRSTNGMGIAGSQDNVSEDGFDSALLSPAQIRGRRIIWVMANGWFFIDDE